VLEFFRKMARDVGRHLFGRKPMHQDRLWLLCTGEQQEVFRLVNLVAFCGKTSFQ